MPTEPPHHVSLEDERPRFRGLGRSGWIAIWAMALLFGLGPVALRWSALGPRYDDAERRAIDTQFAALLGTLPPAPEAESPELHGLAKLVDLASAMHLGSQASMHMGVHGLGVGGHIQALTPTALAMTSPPDLAQVRAALLAWHEGTGTASTSEQVVAPNQLEQLAAELALQHGHEPEVRLALLHMGRVLRNNVGEGFAEAGWTITGYVLTPIGGQTLPPELESELPAAEDFHRHLLQLARTFDISLERAIDTPRGAMDERQRFLGRNSDFSERASADLLEQRTELRELTETLSVSLREASPAHDPSQLLLCVELLSQSNDVESNAGIVFLHAARELAHAGQIAWSSGHLPAPATGGP